MKFIAVYDKDTKDYSSYDRIGFLENAKDIHIIQSINGDYDFEFQLPSGDKKWKFIEPERIVGYDGKYFRVKTIHGQNVIAISLMQDSCRTHIQYIGDMINMQANKIVEEIFKTTSYVTVLSEQELRALGLEPVTDKIDFFEQSKVTPIGCLNILMETLNKYRIHSEIYIDNRKIGLVRKLGQDRGVRVDPKYNARDIKINYTTFGLITKLYPYGKDDLPLGEVQYIKSPNYDTFGEYEAFCNFDEIDDVEELRNAAEYQFSPDNIDRADIPKYSVTAKHLAMKQEIFLGDTVTVVDRDNGITSKQRVISVDIYPKEPNRNTFTAGRPSISTQEAWKTSFAASQYLRTRKNGAANELKTSSIEFMKKNTDVTVENNGKFQKIAQYETGAMFVSPNGKYAVAIIDGKIKIGVKDSTKADGWNWIGVFGHGEGDAATQTFLYTNLITIMSESGELKIEDNLIQMFDSNGTLRFNAGYSKSLDKYVFELYNTDGRRTAYMDDNGNLTICGIFKTGEDGENRVVIDGNGLTSYNANNKKDGLSITTDFPGASLILYSDGDKAFEVRNEGIDSITFRANNSEVMSLSSVRSALGGVWYYRSVEIANKDDISTLESKIEVLENKIKNLSGGQNPLG